MKTSGNTILITGGATGIGFALAKMFDREGNAVIICGRNEETLAAAKKKIPRLHVMRCDIADAAERRDLVRNAASLFPALNVLVNNAGIQRHIDFRKGNAELEKGENEIAANFEAPVHLSALFLPQLLTKQASAIVNISSGLAFVPIAFMPVYCATKAALHSFSLSLRHQLSPTPVRVFEVIPPTVNTGLDHGARSARGQTDLGIPPAEVAEAVIAGLRDDNVEIAVGMAAYLMTESRTNPEKIFQSMNGRFGAA